MTAISAATKRKLVKRLYALADGARPPKPNHGICYNASRMARLPEDDCTLAECVTAMTGTQFPFGWSFTWDGIEGNERRTLAGIMAAMIEAGDLP